MIKKAMLKFLVWIVGISSFGASVAQAQSFNYNINGADFKSQVIYNFLIYKFCPNKVKIEFEIYTFNWTKTYIVDSGAFGKTSGYNSNISKFYNSPYNCSPIGLYRYRGDYLFYENHRVGSSEFHANLDTLRIPDYTEKLKLKTGDVALLNNNNEVKISWSPLDTNSMVYGHKYFVYRNDTLVGTVSGTDSSFNDKVTPNSRNKYKVKCGFKFNSPYDGYNYDNSDSLYFLDYQEKYVICTNTPEYNIFQAVNLNKSTDSFRISWNKITEIISAGGSGIHYRIKKNGAFYKQFTNADPNYILEKLDSLEASNTYVFEIYTGNMGMGNLIYTKTQTVSATFYNQKQSDSYIDIVWNIPTSTLRKANDTSIYVSLYDSTYGKEIYSFQIDTFNSAAYGVNGSFKHFVGPNSYHTYALNMFIIGNGTLLSSTIPSLTANTLTYQRPKLAASSNSYPGKVVLNWKNKSDFASQFYLYRDNLLIANIDTNAITFSDSFAYSGANNIVNGKSYSYILRGYNIGTSSYLAADTLVATTTPVSFMASRNLYANKINLNWNNMGAFAGKLRVRRDGNILSDLTAADVSYTDEKPTYGKKHIYELELWKDDGVIMIVKDTGMVLPIGSVSGYIVSADTFRIGYENVSITAKTTYLRDTFIYNTTTDGGGAFTIPNIYFGTKATLTITAKKAGLNFADSIFNYELSNAVPEISNVIFTYNFKDSLEKNNNNPAVVTNNLHLNAPSYIELWTQDVSFSYILNGNRPHLHWKWENNPNRSFVWQVFRNNILLSTKLEAIGNRTNGYLDYIDTAGVPGQNYQYKVAFYAVGNTTPNGTKKLISYNYFFHEIRPFPSLAGVTNIDLKSIDQQDSGGYVQLKWNYRGANTGFIIYRGGDSIATVFQNKTNSYLFKDYNILFSANYTYEVKAYRTIGKANFVCTTAGTFVGGSNTITTATLPKPYNCATTVSSDNSHSVIVTINTNLGVDYNFDGFYINRYHTTLKVFETFFIRKEMTTSTGSKSYKFIDETALPNVIYLYGNQTAKLAPESRSALWLASTYNETYMPDLPPPSGLTVANNGVANNGYIKVEWDRVVSAKVKHQTYLITASNSATNVIDSIEVAANNIRNYNYILKDNYKGEAINFTIQSCWKYMGKVFYSVTNASNGTQTKGYASKQANNYTAPSNFKASKDRSTHIFLQWDYPTYIVPSAFELYVNGSFEKSIASDVRTYNYFTTDDGTDFVFQLKAIAPKTTGKGSSAWVVASGKVISQRKIKGTVTNLYNSKGIAGIRVDCYYDYFIRGYKSNGGGGYIRYLKEAGRINTASAYTDSSGYYEMIVPTTTISVNVNKGESAALSYYAAAAGANIKLSANNLSITDFQSTKDNRTINFTDTTYRPSAIDNNIAEPSNATAAANSTDKTVEIRWNVSSNNFSGFIIYRDLSQIGTVGKGEAREFIDSFGSSNIQYNYSVKAFWNIDDEVKLSKPAVTSAKFPGLVPVINFKATPLPSSNQVLLSWSHLYDNHSYYEVRRGALILGKINTGSTFTLYDSTGSPNEIYNYSIICYQKMGTRLIKSTRESAQAAFPSIQIVQNLQAGYSVLKDAVKLTWEYKPTNIAGFKIYRGNKYLGFTDKAKSFDFEDISFIPDTTLAYFVTVIAQRDTNTFESRPWKVKAQTPSLIAPVNLQAVQNSNLENFVKLTWQIPTIRGINGYRVFRDNQLLITILDSSRLAYADTSGIFGTTYAYKVDAFATRNERSFYSQAVSANFVYPKLSPPQLTYASDSNFDYIDLNFKYDASSNYGFIVYRDGVEIDTIKVAGRRKYTDMLKTAKANGTGFSYKLRAYKIINNNYYYSDFSNALVGYAGKLMLHYKIDATSGGNYGYKVTMAGNYAMVYAKGRGANNSGEVDVYRKKKYTWELVQTIKNIYQTSGVVFGEYIGMNDSIVLISYHYTNNSGTTYQIYYKLNPSGVFENKGYTDMPNANYAYAINNKRIISGYGTDNTIYVIDIGANNNFSSVYEVKTDQTCSSGSCGPWGATVTMDDSSVYTVSSDTRFYRAYNFQTKKYYAVGKSITDNLDKYEGYWEENKKSIVLSNNNARGSNNTVNSKTLTRLLKTGASKVDGYVMQKSLTGDPYERFYIPNNFSNARVFCGDTTLLLVKDDSAIFVHANDPARAWALRYKLNGTLTDAAFSGNSAVVGSPNGNSGAGSVYFFNFNYSANDPLSVTASKGTIAGKVKIAWTVSNKKINDYYNIYRDGELIDNTAANQFVYYDATGIPGKEYHYAVRIVDTAGNMSNDISDVGYATSDGSIQGYVLSGVSSSGIPNVQVKAYATIDGETFAYYTNTNASGKYNFKNVYYNKAATFYIVPFLAGHKLNRDTTSVDVDLQATQGSAAPFYDLTSYVVKGVIARNTVNCGLDSVNVVFNTIFKNGTTSKIATSTNEQGAYSFVYDPADQTIDYYSIAVDTFRVVTRNNIQDTEFFKFDHVFYDKINLTASSTATYNFYDTAAFPLIIDVKTACGIIPGVNKFILYIASEDGCYEKSITTNNSGHALVFLPALKYSITVKDVETPSANNIQVVNYLSQRNNEIDFSTFGGSDSLRDYAYKNPFVTAFIYHRPPEINMYGFKRYLCNPPQGTEIPIIKQGATIGLNPFVKEVHYASSCGVAGGYVHIINDAAAVGDTTIYFDPVTNSFPKYYFTANGPNVVSPHLKNIVVQYYTADDVFMGDKQYLVIVEGIASTPGSDFIVDVDTSSSGLVQMPLFVLRDPPGDASFSYIEKNTSFKNSLEVSSSDEFAVGNRMELETEIFGAGVRAEFAAKGGGSDGEHVGYEVSVENKQRISTSPVSNIFSADGSTFMVGDRADVIVGGGVVNAYGIANEIIVDDSCHILNKKKIATSYNGLKTTWVYTVDQIMHLIDNYALDIEAISAGQLSSVGVSADKFLAVTKLRKKNWENVLEYHRTKSVPYYNLCNTANYDNIPEPYKTQIRLWSKEGFCDIIGSYVTDASGNVSFVLKPNITWTQALIEKYNKVSEVVRNLSDYKFQLKNATGVSWSQTRLDNMNLDKAYNGLFGFEAENISFSGGGSSFSKEQTVAKSRSSGYDQSSYMDVEAFAGLTFGAEVTTFLGAFAGIGVGVTGGAITTVASATGNVGVTFNFHHQQDQSSTTSFDTSITTGFELNDETAGDQYSVLAFKGIEKNHTPYFVTLGGRSACPPEPGTIYRDDVRIAFERPDGSKVTFPMKGLDPSKQVIVPIKLTNMNPFNEEREFMLEIRPETNQNGAIIREGGKIIGQSVIRVPAQTSQYTNLFIEPNPYYSEYLDIEVGFGSACNWGTIADSTIFMSFYFNSPCSKVSILSPTNNWSIKKEKLKDEQIIFTLGDYDINNKNLDSILMEYKKFGDNKWTQFWAISREELATYYEAERFSGNPPTYPVVWKITNNRKIIDGNYDIRAVSKCDVGGYMYSNITSGKINRSALYVIGDPKPSDGVLSKGEEISVAFNEAINCYGVDSSSQYISFTVAESNVRISTQVYCNQLNGLVFKISDADMAKFDGKLINAKLYNIVDINGNGLAGDTVKWSFVISNNPIFWATNNLEFNITAGTSDSIVTYLFNTGNISRQFSLNGMNGVLDAKPQYPSNLVTLAGMPILVKINATNLKPDSSYTYLLKATIPGFSDLNLSVKVNVYSNDVQWRVNRSLYSTTANIIANFKINGDTSKDSRDKIAVIIDNTVRGFANIRKIDGYWAAYITVYGSSADNGKPMEFRIWKASSGTEFDARPAVSYNYVINKVFGTLLEPIILDVNTAKDTVRYIPLVPGWNSLSFNTVLPSDSINKVLGRLRNSRGTFIKTLNTSAAYNQTKWVSTINLDRLRADSGYMIYLTDYDTLLFSGAASTPKTIPLKEGWNMIGYSYATDKPINSVLRDTASDDGDIIKTSFGEGVSMFDGNNSRWVGSLDTLRRFKSYMIKVQNKDGGTAYKTNYVPFGKTKGLTAVRSAEYGNNMYIQGKILLNGFWSLHDGDQVFAYVGNECRGVGTLEYISALGQSYVSMFVYANKDSEIVSFQILSLADSAWYDCIDSFPFTTNQISGSFSEPYVFKNMNSLMPYTNAKTLISAEVDAYPNPTSKEVQLKLSNLNNQPLEISLTDMSGKKIWNTTIRPDQSTYNYMIDLDKLGLAKGIYMIGVNSHNLAKVIKLVKVN